MHEGEEVRREVSKGAKEIHDAKQEDRHHSNDICSERTNLMTKEKHMPSDRPDLL